MDLLRKTINKTGRYECSQRVPSSPPASLPKITEFETSRNSPDISGTCGRYQRLKSAFPVSILLQSRPFRQKSPWPNFSVKFGGKFPDNGRFTGNFVELTGIPSISTSDKCRKYSVLGEKFPKRRNREFTFKNREFCEHNREFPPTDQGSPIVTGLFAIARAWLGSASVGNSR